MTSDYWQRVKAEADGRAEGMQPMVCNAIGHTHCGKPIEGKPANSFTAHINRGDKPHEWKDFFQCQECVRKDREGSQAAIWNGQDQWRERRQKCDLSLGEMARLLRLGTAEYSDYERCRAVASKDIVFRAQGIFERQYRP